MPGLRSVDHQVSYTPPAVFYELEEVYKAERHKSSKSKKRKHSQREVGDETTDLDEEIDQLASDLEDDASKPSPGKKRKSKSHGGSGEPQKQKGRDRLSTLPSEVLQSIASYLSPGGLLALSHAKKSLRRFFASSSRSKIWVEARRRLALPNLEDYGEMTEEGYAELVYGKRCQSCSKAAHRMPNCTLRCRLCKTCKTEKLVKLDTLSKTHPALHPSSPVCVLRSSQTPTLPMHLAASSHWGFLSDLERESKKLWARQEKDDQDEEARLAAAFEAKRRGANGGRRSRDGSGEEQERATGVGYSYDLARKGEKGERVAKYVDGRREVMAMLEAEGKKLFDAVVNIVNNETNEAASKKDKPFPSSKRRAELECRMLSLGDDFKEEDFSSTDWTTSLLVNQGAQDVDDETWDALKPKLLKLLQSAQQKRLSTSLKEAQAARRAALRPFYGEHRASRTFHPLFGDFLLFPAVRTLWSHQDAVASSDAWAAALPAIEEDLNEWIVSTRLTAVQLVLYRTFDCPDDEEFSTDGDDWGPDFFTDDFLEALSSSLCCNIKGCYNPNKKRPTFYGSLFALLEHQHAEHAAFELAASVYSNSKSVPQTRFDLPLEVATAVDDLEELMLGYRAKLKEAEEEAGEDEDSDEEEEDLTADDIDELFRGNPDLKVGWWTVGTREKEKKGKYERDWRAVLCHVRREAEKAHKANKVIVPRLGLKGEEKATGKKGRK
ncbi:hypothetical protein JCM8547_005789 [Rhodosporidiobolus lusitaniae]